MHYLHNQSCVHLRMFSRTRSSLGVSQVNRFPGAISRRRGTILSAVEKNRDVGLRLLCELLDGYA